MFSSQVYDSIGEYVYSLVMFSSQVYDSIGDVHCDSAEVLVRVLPDSTLREIADLTPQVRKHQVAMATSML